MQKHFKKGTRKMKLRLTHLEQLKMYIDYYSDSGFYYGNKEQFKKRHNELLEWAQDLQDKLLDGKPQDK